MTNPTPETVTVVMPLPSPYLHPNKAPRSRRGYIIKGKLTKERRALAERLATAQCVESAPWPAATVLARFYFTTNRKRDNDNLLAWLKASVDGIADAGIVSDDSCFTYLPVQSFIDKDCPRVEIDLINEKYEHPT